MQGTVAIGDSGSVNCRGLRCGNFVDNKLVEGVLDVRLLMNHEAIGLVGDCNTGKLDTANVVPTREALRIEFGKCIVKLAIGESHENIVDPYEDRNNASRTVANEQAGVNLALDLSCR